MVLKRRPVFYINGVRDALISSAFESGNAGKYVEEKWAAGFVVGDFIKELDLLYKDTDNVSIPTPWGIGYCTAKLHGDPLRRRKFAFRTLPGFQRRQ